MSISENDIIDEKAVSESTCGLVAEVVEGGAGFQSIDCCGVTMTSDDVSKSWDQNKERYPSSKGVPVVIDESKNYPNSCGLKLRIVAGGAGLEKVNCCGNELTLDNDLA